MREGFALHRKGDEPEMETNQARVIIVTGGNSGIGRAVAEGFVQEGAHVVIFGRNQESLRDTATALGPRVTWRQVDVSQRAEVGPAVAAVAAQFGRIDVLVNAAGFAVGVSPNTPLDEAERNWDATIDTNLKGSFLMAVATAPHLTRPGGRIINVSSIAAFTGGSRGGSLDYAAAKAGVIGLTYGLARDLSAQGITVNAVAPGFIAHTGFTGAWSEERTHWIIGQTPAGRAGRAEDVTAAVRYLASREASFVTGEVLNVNGGWLFGR
jgi:3-oxoacyl-[acyl-carrier protein] reductase